MVLVSAVQLIGFCDRCFILFSSRVNHTPCGTEQEMQALHIREKEYVLARKCTSDSVFSLVKFTKNISFTSFFLHPIEKKYAKKRLSDEQAKDDADQQPEVIGPKSPLGLVDLSLPPKVPLIKTELEEQESKWTASHNMLFIFSHFMRQFC